MRYAKKALTSSGAWDMKSRYILRASRDFSTGYRMAPAKIVLTGCALNSKDVTTPKLPLPPRSAQKRSAFSLALAVTKPPSAVTTSAEIMLSQERPYLRAR
jgi:hypothetical protein